MQVAIFKKPQKEPQTTTEASLINSWNDESPKSSRWDVPAKPSRRLIPGFSPHNHGSVPSIKFPEAPIPLDQSFIPSTSDEEGDAIEQCRFQMALKPCCARFAISLSWFSPQVRPAVAKMPLRARITNPAFAAAGQRKTMATSSSSEPQIPMEQPGDEPDDVLFSTLYGVRTIELNRPKKLNSLNGSMARKIIPRLREWEKSDMANIILMSGAGSKAFCAGGDVAALAQQNQKGVEGQKESTDYFALEYQLDHLIATYSKPYVAIMDGITMGGGVGLSVHAPFRIATERTVFAMPETTIGFFPDVGGSFFLSRLDGETGTYLALTSERLLGVQAFYAGIATHYLDSSVLSSLTARLSELVFRDYAPLPDRLNLINSTIAEFSSSLPSPDSYANSNGDLRGDIRVAIDRCFQYNTIEEILDALKRETESSRPEAIKGWARKTSETILSRSPTSLKVTLRQLRAGRDWSIAQTFINEHIIASRFMRHPDFVEGVSARLIKPLREPKWNPSTLEDVKAENVDAFFQQQEGVEKVGLFPPIPGKGLPDYQEYPHTRFALPTEADIRQAQQELAGSGHGANESSVLQHLLQKWDGKEGIDVKVRDYFARGKARKPNQ